MTAKSNRAEPFPGCIDSSCSALAFRSAARRLTVLIVLANYRHYQRFRVYKRARPVESGRFVGESKSDETEVWFER